MYVCTYVVSLNGEAVHICHNGTKSEVCALCLFHCLHLASLSVQMVPARCCNTCDQVREAYRKKGWAFNNAEGITQCLDEGWVQQMSDQSGEGCRASGFFDVSKVAGNFHFAPGKSFQSHNVHGKYVHTYIRTYICTYVYVYT